MKFIYADSQDQIDGNYDFENEKFSIQAGQKKTRKRNPQLDDLYPHEYYESIGQKNGHLQPTVNCYHGLLVSRTTIRERYSETDIQNHTIQNFLRFPKKTTRKASPDFPVIVDSGAFKYKDQENPPFDTESTVRFYKLVGCTHGVSLDHIPFQTSQIAKARSAL